MHDTEQGKRKCNLRDCGGLVWRWRGPEQSFVGAREMTRPSSRDRGDERRAGMGS